MSKGKSSGMVGGEQRKKRAIEIAGRRIGEDYPCFVVAEISANHHGNFNEAVELIKTAAKAGADAVKFQHATPDGLTLDCNFDPFMVKGQDIPKIWRGQSLYQLYQKTCTPWEWFPKLQKVAKKARVLIFSTPFEVAAVDELERRGVPCYKIASYEALDIPLLRRVARTGKPVIISQGFFGVQDVKFSLKTLRDAGAKDIVVLHCVSQYSGEDDPGVVNLRNIVDLRERFGFVSGFSDNNIGVKIPILAAAMGAAVVEKHFIMDRSRGGPDARFSIEPKEFVEMVRQIRENERFKGVVQYGPGDAQAVEIMKFIRSLFVAQDIRAGEILTEENIRSVRPAGGLAPKYWDKVIGKRARRDVNKGTPLSWDIIKK